MFDCRYACEHCGKRFARGGQLMVHRRTHTGDKPYACTECPLRFTSSGNLKTHAKLHAGAREYQCHLCDKAYPRADTLKRHILRYVLAIRISRHVGNHESTWNHAKGFRVSRVV